MVFLIESESSITYVTPKKQNLLFEEETCKEQNELYRFFWAKNSTSFRENEGSRPIKIICRRTFLVSISIFSTLFHFFFIIISSRYLVLSLRTNSVCEPEGENDFRDVKLFVLILANQIKGYNTARVTPRDLAR